MARKFSGNALLLATHNAGKAAEIMSAFAPLAIPIKTLADFNLPVPDETGESFLANATLKALAAARAANMPALADDSGFCVQALGGAPGVYTADWAEQPDGTRNYNQAFEKINSLLVPHQNHAAAFVATLVLAWPDGHVEVTEGQVTGAFVFPPRGQEGFGYDPCFVPSGHSQTFAELGPHFKKQLSHRARALDSMINKCFR